MAAQNWINENLIIINHHRLNNQSILIDFCSLWFVSEISDSPIHMKYLSGTLVRKLRQRDRVRGRECVRYGICVCVCVCVWSKGV